MTAVALVILLGLGVGALGLVAADLYIAGLLIVFIGVIGAVVVAGDRLVAAAYPRPGSGPSSSSSCPPGSGPPSSSRSP